MSLTIASLIINFLVMCGFFIIDEPSLAMVMLGAWLVSLLGSIGFMATKAKPAAYVAMAGFALFIPIGAIGIVGLRKILDAIGQAEFDRGRT